MASNTGSPYNIPFIEATDLLRDYPTTSLGVANNLVTNLNNTKSAANITSGTLAKARMAAGTILNVVQVVKTDTFTTASAGLQPVTGLNVTITPSSSSSKVLVLANFIIGNSSNDFAFADLQRGTTSINLPTGGISNNTSLAFTVGAGFGTTMSIAFLDSPGVSTATNYRIVVARAGGTVTVGRAALNDRRAASTITAIEVAA